jgi:endo-1,4-beta-xylanase
MKPKWIFIGSLLLILVFQFKNILAFIGMELALQGFVELDSNSDGLIQKTEWPGLGFSLVDLDGDNIASEDELREFIKEFSKEFSWQNEVNERYNLPDQLIKGSFISRSMSIPVGYYIYIPDSYHKQPDKNFRTVYYLHGARPGNEARSVYISVNGGELSHYNSEQKNSNGEDVFIKELIPHIDGKYRTINHRSSRGLEGFSQGGRGATRYMFKYPELFGTVSAGGGSYMVEKLIQKNNGFEDDPRDNDQEIYYVGKGNDAWSLAKEYKASREHNTKFLLWSGELDPNLMSIQEYAAYLNQLEVDHSLLVLADVEHNPFAFYGKGGENLIKFHLGD